MFWYLLHFRFLKAPPKDKNPYSLPDTVMGSSMPSIKIYFVFRFFALLGMTCEFIADLGNFSLSKWQLDFHRWMSARMEKGATRLFVSWTLKTEQSIFIIRQYRFYWNWSHFRAFSDIELNLSQSNSNRLIFDGSFLFI